MATKVKSVWFCSHCGNEYAKWMGKCPACGEWNTMVEKEVATGGAAKKMVSVPGAGRKPMRLTEVSTMVEDRISLANGEVDRILGGGIVRGSLVLVEAGEDAGGPPRRRCLQLLHLQ